MLRDNRFRLVTLGRLTLVGTGGEEDASLARRRLKLAVLAVLALSRRPVSRDTLLGLFWAEHDEARARHSLSNALSSLRGALGERSITTRDAEVSLDPEAPLDVDCIEFIEALEGKDFSRAVELYAGPFLEGFHVDESPAFEQWVSRERRRLESLFIKACSEHCASLARSRRWSECEAVAHQWLETEPLSADAAIYFLNAIKSPGTRAALAKALEEFEALRTRLTHEYDLAPHPSVMELSSRIREQLAAAPPEPVVSIRVTHETKIEPIERLAPPAPPVPAPVIEPPTPVAPQPALTSTSRRSRMIGVAIGALAVVAAGAVAAKSLVRPSNSDVNRPVIAVLPLPLRGNDSASAWLIDGLPQMIDGKLSSVSAIEVVSQTQIRALVIRSGRKSGDRFPEADARDLAQRVGATVVVHGSLARDGQNYVLDLAMHDVRGPLVRSFVLTDTDPLSLADQAAARILAAANVSLGGPRLQDVETSSLEAYQHYIRSIENGQAGRVSAAIRDLEASIALDSGFIPALRARLGIAAGINDTVMVRKMRALIRRHAARSSEFDRLDQELDDAYTNGERERAQALARALVRRYPRDPRVYWTAVALFSSHGAFEEAERVAIAGLGLDSLAMRAGSGPCTQCVGFFHIIHLAMQRQDFDAAANWARRWISTQPDAPSPWATLALTYFFAQKTDSALLLQERAITLSGSEQWALDSYARMLLVSRRYAAADSIVRRMAELHGDRARAEVADLTSLLARERGRFREADRIILGLATGDPEQTWFVNLVHADNRKLLGDYANAARMYEQLVHGPSGEQQGIPNNAGSVRAWCWHHALAADALGPQADTSLLRGIADSLEMACNRSYYGRDWLLYHHVRGLLAMRTGRYADADREFSQARWVSVEGWGRIAVELAKARMAVGKPLDAIPPLREAYATRLDAMGRYVPISELDYWMSLAFAAAGQADSARVYAGYVDRAWQNADPEVRQRLPVRPGTAPPR